MTSFSNTIAINSRLNLNLNEVELSAIRAQGAGGQNVNKVSSAIHLRFDIAASSLPADVKQRLFCSGDSRITSSGVIVLKAQSHRTQELNRNDALLRLAAVIRSASVVQKKRVATKPSRSAKRKRVDNKVKKGRDKALRGRVSW